MKKLFMILVVVAVGCAFFFLGQSEAVPGNWWGALQFAADNTSIKFFDPSHGKVYIYSQVDGKYIQTLSLQDLGHDMTVEYRKTKPPITGFSPSMIIAD